MWISCAYRKDIAQGRKPDISKPGTEFHIEGLHNIIFLVMIVAAVILSGVLPGLSAFQNAAGEVMGIHIFGEVTLTFPALIEIVMILLAAFLSFKTTDKSIRRRNHFTWGAIQEVAVLFIGIFITMQPALDASESTWTSSWTFQSACKCSGQPVHCPVSWIIHQLIWYFLPRQEPLDFLNGVTTSLGTVPVKLLVCDFLWCGIYGSQHIYR